MTLLTLAVFALTWVLIAARRLAWLPLGRPAGALLGAVLMVAVGALSPAEAYAAIDHDTIVLLLGTMLVAYWVERAGLLEDLAARLVRSSRSPAALLVLVSVFAGAASALFVNDTVCVALTPLVVLVCTRAGLPLGPYLVALATGANLGSAATLVGNPQNMIIGSLSAIPFARFLALVGPAAIVALAVNAALLVYAYRKRLPRAFPQRPELPRFAEDPRGLRERVVVTIVLTAMVGAFLAGAPLGFAALGAAVALMLRDRAEPTAALARVDWGLLLFFAALFVVVEGAAATGWVERAWLAVAPHVVPDAASGVAAFTGFSVVGANVFSNVPFVMLVGPHLAALARPELAFALLAFTATAAGNLTLLGSVANLIVAERARPAHDLSFFEYLRFGLPATLIVLAVATPVLVATAVWLA